jgi:acyl-coenzyme A thioesterase PaaI-like protein
MKLFETEKQASFKTKIERRLFNIFPAYRSTGARVMFISHDYSEIHVKLRLYWRTRNYVGTVFGGSIFGALDPMHMIQLIRLLGDDYVVWDKEAKVRFVRPISKPVFARFLVTEELLDEIRKEVAEKKEVHRVLHSQFEDREGKVYATVDKTIYIAEKSFYKEKRKAKKAKKVE